MEVRETGLQAKPGFAGQTWNADGTGFAGHIGSCWPNWTLLAKPNCRPNRVLLAKPGLQAKRDFRPNRVLQAKPGFQAKRDCRPNQVLLAILGLLVLKPNSRPRTQDEVGVDRTIGWIRQKK